MFKDIKKTDGIDILELVQARIGNGSIIKSTRPAKFNTVYSAFFKQFPIIGKNRRREKVHI